MATLLKHHLLSFVFSLFLLSFQGCALLVVPMLYIGKAGEGKKDVSADFERGHIIGKEFELVKDLYLTQTNDTNELYLGFGISYASYTDKNGNRIDIGINPSYYICKTIPEGARFRVCGVSVKTSYGFEGYRQYIYANLIDETGNSLPTTNYQGKVVHVNVSELFEDTSQMPEVKWFFNPKLKYIKEITAD